MNDSLLLNHIFNSCNKLIHSEYYKIAYRIGNAFTRSRKLSFSNTIYFILGSSKKALSSNLADFRDSNPTLRFPQLSRQAFSKARAGIHFEAFQELFRLSANSFYHFSSTINKWKNHVILAVDGTSLQLPDTSENRNTFGFIKNQHSPGRAICSASILYDVLNDVIIDGTLARYGFSERKLALKHLTALSCLDSFPSSILTFDRGYPSQEIFHELDRYGLKFVIRVASSFKISNKISSPDSLLTNTFHNKTITLRCINLTLSSGLKEQLLTNLLDSSFTIPDFSELYFLRWGVEVKYKELKSRLQIEEFTGNRPSSIMQDFYASLFFSNLVSLAKRCSDSCIKNDLSAAFPQKQYQTNRSFLISRMRHFLINLFIHKKNRLYLIERIINEAKKVRSQIIPDRNCERKAHLFQKKHYKNMKTCL